ncbi:class I SAM-dependent methyltransferase [Segetibacter sp. 3557_3]|uniref:class I SAM-dependent methyltransferase n=1 Tax=Segetibacter sp. 3557_3 TaxID=2547429 RepID=UPI001058A054|nr:class I SAM-dependent methyltransferase [Segetibacter sp. 3557_3]TDH23516.1 class I SAM-dependent methyltransferase [Segetibacter sp. 3557_3]
MKDIYNDKSYLRNNPSWHEEDAPGKVKQVLTILKRNRIAFETICEIGCGSGEILAQLAKQLPGVNSFRGYDISRDAIEIAKQKANDRVSFEVKDITQSDKEVPFDLLMVIDVIEHIPDYFKFLAGIIHKGRYTIFHIPLDMCMWSLFKEQMLVESKKRVGHIHNFTEDFIKSVLAEYGFELIDQLYTPPTFEQQTAKQQVVDTFRKLLFKINQRFCTKTVGGYSLLLLTKNNWVAAEQLLSK